MIEGKYRYYAFISYQREDEQWARWLQHKLEHYKLPANLNGRTDLPRDIRPVFKDTSELTPGNLPEQISEALDLSKYLIIICSPRSAQSQWVNKEVETFMSMGRRENIIPFIIDGTPFSYSSDKECFPKAILSLPQEQEILGANINEMGRDAAAVKTVARMFDLRFDELWQRHEREKKRRRTLMAAFFAVLLLLISGIALWMYLQRQETLRANWEMMENQARMVAEKSKEEVIKGNTLDAILALLEMLPEDGSRPFVPELEEALRIAYDSLQSSEWHYKYMGKCMDDAYFSNDEKYMIIEDYYHVDIYDTKSLCLVTSIYLSDYQWRKYTFLSTNSDTLYNIINKDSVDCYDVPTGKYIKSIPLTSQLRKKWIATNNNGTHLSYLDNHWSWIDEWKRNIGLSQDKIIINYLPTNNMVLYCQGEDGFISPSDDSVTLYDSKQKKDVLTIEDAHTESQCFSSFSPDGKLVVIDGRIMVDIENKRVMEFDGGRETGEFKIGRNNQLLYYSPDDNYIRLYDSQSLLLIDSVKVAHCSDYEINSKGNLLLVQNAGEWCIYYKYDGVRRKKIRENEITFPELKESGYKNVTWEGSDTVIDKRFSIYMDYEGVHITDLSGGNTNWRSIEEDNDVLIKGVLPNNHYVIASLNSRYDDSSMTAIMDFESGAIVKQIRDLDGDVAYYYNEDKQELAIVENDNIIEMLFFPSFDQLVSMCREATDGMKLGGTARKKFHLE